MGCSDGGHFNLSALLRPQPLTEFRAFGYGHPGGVAKGHGLAGDRLGHHLLIMAPYGIEVIKHDPARRCTEGSINRLSGVAAGTMGSHDFKCPAVADVLARESGPPRGNENDQPYREKYCHWPLPGKGFAASSGVVGIKEMADDAARDHNKRNHKPAPRGSPGKEHGVVRAHHQQQHRQGKIVVMQRALLGLCAKRRAYELLAGLGPKVEGVEAKYERELGWSADRSTQV